VSKKEPLNQGPETEQSTAALDRSLDAKPMEHHFEIVPYEGAGQLKFGASRQDVENVLGPPGSFHRTDYPEKMGLSPVYEAQYDSSNINLAYDLDCKLNYICFSQHRTPFQGTVSFQGINIFVDDNAFLQLLEHDSEPFEWVGFIFLMKLGMRLEGFHTTSDSGLIVSLFERGRYDSKLTKFSPYVPPTSAR
jgi:hypothetical protein